MLSKEKENDPEALGSSNYRCSLEPEPGCSSCTPGILTRVSSGCSASQGWLLLDLWDLIYFYPLIHSFCHSKSPRPHSSTFGGYTSLGTGSTAWFGMLWCCHSQQTLPSSQTVPGPVLLVAFGITLLQRDYLRSFRGCENTGFA